MDEIKVTIQRNEKQNNCLMTQFTFTVENTAKYTILIVRLPLGRVIKLDLIQLSSFSQK